MNQETPCHIAVTHSPLVSQIFEAVMRLLAITEKDVYWFSRRCSPYSGRGMAIDDLSDAMEVCFKKCDRKGYRELCGKLDSLIQSLTGGRTFEAYIPHANKIIYQEIITHPKCSGYSFIEEGFTSMAWNTLKNARLTAIKILRNRLRTWVIHPRYMFKRPMFIHTLPHYRAAYAISNYAFQGMPGRIDVSAFLSPMPQGIPPGKIYLILDACYLHTSVKWENYEDALLEAVLEQTASDRELLVKFHFADSESSAKFESLRQRLSDEKSPPLRLLSSNFPVEKNLTKQDVLLFAFTSLGYYSALMGIRVSCFAGNIEGVSLSRWIAKGKLPENFSEVVGVRNE